MNFSLETSGDDRALAHVLRLADRAGHTTPFMERVARVLLAQTKALWQQSPWTPLDPDTVRRKARAGQDPRILRATGTLERALTVWRAPGQRLDIRPFELVFGLRSNGKAYYGRFHQLGRGVPRREVIPFTRRRLVTRVRDLLRRHLLD